MQEGEGKTSRKSDEIAKTPTRGQTVEVTPRMNATEREQANAKKAKRDKKKGLEDYFGTGVRVPPPSLAGTPTDAVGIINLHATTARKIRGGTARLPRGHPRNH